MNTDFEKKYCKKIVEGVVREVLNEMLSENMKIQENHTAQEELDALIILENLENGIKNIHILEEKKKDKKSGTEKKKSKSTKKKKKDKKERDEKSLKVMKKQVLSMLNQDKFDMAAVAREVYPKMDDDARRSYVSRQSRGLENIANDKVTDYYHALRSASKGRKNNQF